jgi:ribose transport system permease protein
VGALIAVGGVVAAALSARGSALAVCGAVAATTALGLVNGLLVTRARIQPFITTLGMMFGARGMLLALTNEASIRVARDADALKWLGRGWLGPVPVPVLAMVLVFAAAWLVLTHTRFGRHVYAVGDNAEAARLMGLDVDRVVVRVYAISGALSGLAGVVLASRVNAGQPVAGAGWELSAITAVVVGGTLLTGGQGGVLSTLVGVLLMGVVFNLFNLEGTVSSYWQWVLRGVFLLVVVVVQKRLSTQVARGGPTAPAPA